MEERRTPFLEKKPGIDSPLSDHFSFARKCYDWIIDNYVTSNEEKDLIVDVLNELDICMKLVNSLSLFSSNDRIEEIPPENLKYLLVEFYAANVYDRCVRSPLSSGTKQAQTNGPDKPAKVEEERSDAFRLEILKHTSQLLKGFLSKLQSLGLTLSKDSVSGSDKTPLDNLGLSETNAFKRREMLVTEARLERDLAATLKTLNTKDEEEFAKGQMIELRLAAIRSRKLLRQVGEEQELIQWGIDHAEELKVQTGTSAPSGGSGGPSKGISMMSLAPDGSVHITNSRAQNKNNHILSGGSVNSKVSAQIKTTNSILNSAEAKTFVPLDEYQLKKKGKLEQKSITEARQREQSRLDGISKVYNNPGYSYEPDNVNTTKRGGIPGLFAGPSFNVNNTVAMNEGRSNDGYVWTEGTPFGIGEMGEWVSSGIKSTSGGSRIVGRNIDEQLNNESRGGDPEVFNITYKRGYEPEDYESGGKHEDAPDYDTVGVYMKRGDDDFHDDVKAGSGNTHGKG